MKKREMLDSDDSWARYLCVLSPLGRMALTCYLLLTLIGVWLFYGFMPGPDLMGKIGPV